MTDTQNTVGKYIDKKADWARTMALNSTDKDFWNHLACVLDALADEIRIGLHEMNVDTPVL